MGLFAQQVLFALSSDGFLLLWMAITLLSSAHLLTTTCCGEKKDKSSGKTSKKAPKQNDDIVKAEDKVESTAPTMTARPDDGGGGEGNGVKKQPTDKTLKTSKSLKQKSTPRSQSSIRPKPSQKSAHKSLTIPNEEDVPTGKLMGNIDEQLRKKKPEDIAEGISRRHAFDSAPQKDKIRRPKPTEVAKMVEGNVIYLCDDASKTKSASTRSQWSLKAEGEAATTTPNEGEAVANEPMDSMKEVKESTSI